MVSPHFTVIFEIFTHIITSKSHNKDFVVHRGRTIPTLATAMQDQLMTARLRQAKEKSNTDSKAEERGKRHALLSFNLY